MKYGLTEIRTVALFLGAAASCFGQRAYTATALHFPSYNIAYLNWIGDDGKTGFGGGTRFDPYAAECFTYQDGVVTVIATPGQGCGALSGNTGTYLFLVSPPVPAFPAVQGPGQLFAYKNNQFNALLPPDGITFNYRVGTSGVNSKGQIAITLLCPAPATYTYSSSVYCPYSISTSGTFMRLPGDQGGHAYATAINANGDIAGFVSPPSDHGAGSSPLPIAGNLVVWPQAGGIRVISNPANIQLNIPVAMNSKGQIVGPGYIYDGVATIAPLQMTGASKVTPISMNESGEVVGSFQSKAADGLNRPFYYANGTAVDLNALVPDLPKNTLLENVSYINNAGQILVTGVDLSQSVGAIATGAAATQYLLTPSNASLTMPVITSVTNAASFATGLSSSALIAIQGVNLSTETRQWTDSDFVNGKLPTTLSGVSVIINGTPAYVNYVSPSQINVIAPDDAATGPVQVQVTNPRGTSNSFTANKSDLMPAFFTVGSKPFDYTYQGGYYVAALHADGTPVGSPGLVAGAAYTPARQGEEIQLFGTGFGATVPPASAGQILTAPVVLANPVTMKIDGKPAQVLYAGRTANGLNQINVIVPNVFPDGDVVVEATVNGVVTQAKIFLTVKY